MRVTMQVLGRQNVCGDDGRPIDALLAQPKRLALFAYLVLKRPVRLHRRDELLATFWPERQDDHARGTLSQALSFLRRTLGDDVILSRGDEVGVDRELVQCDALSLVEAAAARDHARVVALHVGDLLETFQLGHCQAFGSWLAHERQFLRGLAVRSAMTLADAAAERGDWTHAVEAAEQAINWAPCDEVAARALVIALERAGHRAHALEVHDAFVARLARELDLAPSDKWRTLREAIRSGADVGDTLSRRNLIG